MRTAELRRAPVQLHSVQAEEAVLGAQMMDAAAVSLVGARIEAEHFFQPRHQLIQRAVTALSRSGRGVDPVTVSEMLERYGKLAEAGGLAYLSTLARDTPTAVNVNQYAEIVRERADRRQLRQDCAEFVDMIDQADDRSSTELAAALTERLLRRRAKMRAGQGLVASAPLVQGLLDDLDRQNEGQRGLQLGLADFDQLTCGLEPGDLVVIAARPGMGKTALLVSIACNVGTRADVAVFSAEMPARQLMRRSLAQISKISQGKLRRAQSLSDQEWAGISQAAIELTQLRIYVDETSQPSMSHVRAEVTSLKSRGALGLVLVDYVQLLTGNGRNRYERLRDIAYGLKAMAKDLAVPVVVLAQLNREVEGRENRRPHISDLRDSGAIEEAADIIGLLYSEGYYNPDFAMPYALECQVAKNRNGERGECLWSFAGDRSLVQVLDSGAAMEYRRIRAELQPKRRSRTEDL